MDSFDHDGGLALNFRPMLADDLTLMHEWLQRPHIRQWWGKRKTYEDVVEHYLPAILGSKPVDLFLILFHDQPIGFIQSYLLAEYPDDAQQFEEANEGEGAAGVDIFIAEPDLLGKGVGSEALRRFVSEIVFVQPTTNYCIADPEASNIASVRAFQKAGFYVVEEFLDPRDSKTRVLVRLDREQEQVL
jgi:RimJ/RimL family protein N-acetyltransferase